jgi:glycosyltransferase involved in cell wall biosynthesis
MTDCLVSVVMPAFNEEAFIAAALQSALAQSYERVELIVVDDGSTDRTAAIAAAHGVRVLRRPHQGAAAACNAGLVATRGDYWAIFDADDVMPRERLERQVAYLERHPDLGMTLGLTEAFVTPGERRPEHYNAAWDEGPFPACTGTMLARRELLDVVGLFDEARPIAYDLDWLARAKDAGIRAGHVDELALRYRIHAGNATSDHRAVNLAMLKVLRDSLQRRRAGRVGG